MNSGPASVVLPFAWCSRDSFDLAFVARWTEYRVGSQHLGLKKLFNHHVSDPLFRE